MEAPVPGRAGVIEDRGPEDGRATRFSANGFPLLSAGSTTDLVARSSSMWVHVKLYAEGGENGLHAHRDEDHVFVVLGGEATFMDEHGAETVVASNDGILIPHGTLYCFRSSGGTNLVMLRIGAAATAGGDRFETWAERIGRGGEPAPGDAPGNGAGAVRGVPVPGRTFGR